MNIDNKIVYLVLQPKNFMTDLTMKEWNNLISSYENDENAIVEEYDEKHDGYCYITTSLFNILENHDISDLRFMSKDRKRGHKTDFFVT